jgi:hypothetical protein
MQLSVIDENENANAYSFGAIIQTICEKGT